MQVQCFEKEGFGFHPKGFRIEGGRGCLADLQKVFPGLLVVPLSGVDKPQIIGGLNAIVRILRLQRSNPLELDVKVLFYILFQSFVIPNAGVAVLDAFHGSKTGPGRIIDALEEPQGFIEGAFLQPFFSIAKSRGNTLFGKGWFFCYGNRSGLRFFWVSFCSIKAGCEEKCEENNEERDERKPFPRKAVYFRASRNLLPGLNFGTLHELIEISFPVLGFLPVLAALSAH